MTNFVDSIYEFNNKAGLIESGYDPYLETSMSIEESLEDIGPLVQLADQLETNETSPRALSRKIAALACTDDNSSLVSRVDKHIDNIVINFGSLFKAGLTKNQVIEAIDIVCEANLNKLSAGKDEFGKQLKPDGWESPESKLQAMLDK